MFRNDRQKMIAFIASQLSEAEATLVLASGVGGDIIATVIVHGDDIVIDSRFPEWVSVREVYEHVRWRAMPGWEQRAWLHTATSRQTPDPRLERITYRLEQAAVVIERHSGRALPSPEVSLEQATVYGQIRVNRADKEITICSKTYPLDDIMLDILACLVAAQGNWITRADMQSSSRLLRDEERLDRSISRLKKTLKAVEPLIESSPRGYRMVLPETVE